jgi:hypothetical protein
MKSFATAMMQSLKLEHETASQFASQLRQLSPQDKADYHKALIAAGIDCTAPLTKVAA